MCRIGVLGEEAFDQIGAGRGQLDDHDAAVGGVAAAPDQAAVLERAGHLGRVRLRPAEPAAQGAQLERAARRGEHHQHREAGGGDALPGQLGRDPTAHGRLGTQERLQRTMCERIAELSGIPGGTTGVGAAGRGSRAARSQLHAAGRRLVGRLGQPVVCSMRPLST